MCLYIENIALEALMAMHGSCKPENTVRFCTRAPKFNSHSVSGYATSFGARSSKVRVLHARPIIWMIISAVEYHIDIVKVAGSIPASSTN